MTSCAQTHRAVADDAAPEPSWSNLFNCAAFHALNVTPGDVRHRIEVPGDDGRAIGALAGVLHDGRLINGHSAPFGGLDLARPRETPRNVDTLVRGVIAGARAIGAREIEVRARPAAYGPSEPLIAFALLNQGFRVARAELNQQIELTGLRDVDDYLAGLRSPARRALKHLAATAFSLHAAHDAAAWDRCYDILALNRAAKGRALSLSRAYVERARIALGDAVRMTEIRADDQPCAAALTYRVAPGRELVVAWGDAGHDLARSPMNMVALLLVERALKEGVELLDLGISNEPDPAPPLRVNDGLAQFKQSVGAGTGPRLRLVRALD